MHSGLVILLWLLAVASLQFLSAGALLIAVLGSATLALAYARQRCWRLVRRVRVLLLAIFVLFAWFTPGEAVFAHWPVVSPSKQGVALALEHAGRLLAVVFCVAVLMQYLPSRRLVGAIHALLRPLSRCGVPADRVAIRTLLVLEYVDSDARTSWRDWLRDVPLAEHEPVRIPVEPLRMTDFLIGALVLCGLVLVVVMS